MKTFVTTFAFTLALFVAAGASAQRRSMVSTSAADSVLLSETTDGDYLVRRYMVRNQGDADYTVRYRINLAELAPSLDNNTTQLDRLGAFIDRLMRDTSMQVKSVTITGYSSPDGSVAFNEALARKRAQDFRSYVNRKYNLSGRYDVTLNSVAEDWEMCRALVTQSSIPDKQTVLNIIDSNRSIEAKEQELKRLPPVWNYMKQHILPPLRRVEMTIDYGTGTVVELRKRIVRPAPAPAPKPAPKPQEPCCYAVVDDSATGIIVELPVVGRDFDEYERKLRHDYNRTARKEARMARKMAKAEAKAAKKTYKELERGMR